MINNESDFLKEKRKRNSESWRRFIKSPKAEINYILLRLEVKGIIKNLNGMGFTHIIFTILLGFLFGLSVKAQSDQRLEDAIQANHFISCETGSSTQCLKMIDFRSKLINSSSRDAIISKYNNEIGIFESIFDTDNIKVIEELEFYNETKNMERKGLSKEEIEQYADGLRVSKQDFENQIKLRKYMAIYFLIPCLLPFFTAGVSAYNRKTNPELRKELIKKYQKSDLDFDDKIRRATS